MAANNFGTAFTGLEDKRTLTNPYGTDQKIYDAVFGQLTQHTEQDRKTEMDRLGEELALKGIPVGSDLYNKQMAEANRRFDDNIANAQGQATIQSQNAYQQAFTNQETLRQNTMSERQAVIDENAKILSTLSDLREQYRKGLLSKQELDAQIKLNKQKLDLERQRIAKMGASSPAAAAPVDNGISPT